jgi:hypothetical protein
MAYGKYWGTYGSFSKFDHAGWHIELCSFTYTEPEGWAGKTSWRYRMSRNTVFQGLWTDKNPRGRKFETRCFTSSDEAKAAALVAAEA